MPPVSPVANRPDSSCGSPDPDAIAAARKVGLRYVTDAMPGWQRIRRVAGFRYRDVDGSALRDPHALERIKRLGIPPAWEDVWICPLENGHLQATGRDAKGRKQYRYHPSWRRVRDETKYERMISFGQALPRIRERLEADLARPGQPREKVLATVVHLLQTTMIRVGNEEYARANGSYGLTTLRNRHVQIRGGDLQFSFRGKSGIRHTVRLTDRRLARIIRQMRDLPGQTLFQYVDEAGETHPVDSADVNDYLRAISGEDFTAKDFRTWSGTMLAALALQECEHFSSEAEARRNVTRAIEHVAARLGNTPAICRKCYVHPVVIDSYFDRSILTLKQEALPPECGNDPHALSPEEVSIITLLQQRMAAQAKAGTAVARPQPSSARRTKQHR